MILKGLEVGPFATNCYIVGSEATMEGMIIDPGDHGKKIAEFAEKIGLTITLIVLTHGHMDHTAGLAAVKEATGAEIAAHEIDAKAMQGESRSFTQIFGLKYDTPPQPERMLEDGDIVEIGDLKFKVIYTPGHTMGGITLYGHGVAFVGDTLFKGSIGRYDLPNSDGRKLMDSLKNRLMALPDETVVYPGHGEPTTIGEERVSNPFLRMNAF